MTSTPRALPIFIKKFTINCKLIKFKMIQLEVSGEFRTHKISDAVTGYGIEFNQDGDVIYDGMFKNGTKHGMCKHFATVVRIGRIVFPGRYAGNMYKGYPRGHGRF